MMPLAGQGLFRWFFVGLQPLAILNFFLRLVVLIDDDLFVDWAFNDGWVFDCFYYVFHEVADDWNKAYLSQKINEKRQEKCCAEDGAEADQNSFE